MSKNTTHQLEAKNTKPASNDIVVGNDIVIGKGIIKAVESNCQLGWMWALPGGGTTRSKERAVKCAGIINSLIIKGQAA